MGGGGQLWDCFGGVRLCLGCVWEAVLIRGYSVFGEGGGRTDTVGFGLGGQNRHLWGRVMEVALLWGGDDTCGAMFRGCLRGGLWH